MENDSTLISPVNRVFVSAQPDSSPAKGSRPGVEDTAPTVDLASGAVYTDPAVLHKMLKLTARGMKGERQQEDQSCNW